MECTLNDHTLTIIGNIKNISDISDIKNKLRSIQGDQVQIITKELTVLTSDIIGTLLRMVNQDRKNITITTDSDSFLQLLERLKLTDILSVRKG